MSVGAGLLALALSFGAAPVAAQGVGYGVAGLAGVSGFFASLATLHGAGGGELLVRGRAGVGGEVGFIGTSGVLGLGSVNGVVHLVPNRADHKVSPFVTGGYTRMGNADGAFNAWNAGPGPISGRRSASAFAWSSAITFDPMSAAPFTTGPFAAASRSVRAAGRRNRRTWLISSVSA